MFQVLLKDARSRDIIQTSYDTLLEHLEGALPGTASPLRGLRLAASVSLNPSASSLRH